MENNVVNCPLCGAETEGKRPQKEKNKQPENKINGLVIAELAVIFIAVLLGIFVLLQAFL